MFYLLVFLPMIPGVWSTGRIYFRKPLLYALMAPPVLGIPIAFAIGLGTKVTSDGVAFVFDVTELGLALAWGLGPFYLCKYMKWGMLDIYDDDND